MSTSSPSALSPCIGVCRINDDKVCVGCFRTLDEIAAWSALSHRRRRQIMAEIPARKQSMQDKAS